MSKKSKLEKLNLKIKKAKKKRKFLISKLIKESNDKHHRLVIPLLPSKFMNNLEGNKKKWYKLW